MCHNEKVLFMRIFITVLVLIFSLQSWTKADDISDFEIEGMSIGDSLLDFVSKDEIEKKKSYYPNSKKWALFVKQESSLEIFDGFQVHFKEGDGKYIIGTIDGHISYENNIEDCYEKMDEIVLELSETFKDARKMDKKVTDHELDKSGKFTDVTFWFESGDIAMVECNDWSEESNYIDKLTVKMGTKEFIDWINIEAY